MGENHADSALTLNNLAVMYYSGYPSGSKGDFAQAEPFYLSAIAVSREALGPLHPLTLKRQATLGNLYSGAGEYDAAGALLREVLAARKQTVGEKHADYADALHGLGGVARDKGDFDKAESLYQEALAVHRGLGSPGYVIAPLQGGLGRIYFLMGDADRAEKLLREALASNKQTQRERPSDYAEGLHGLALLYRSTGEYARAEPLLREALEVRRQALGEKHPRYALNLCALAELYDAMGDDSRAESLYRQALPVARQVFGEHHPEYIKALDGQAMWYSKQGNYTQAEAILRQAMYGLELPNAIIYRGVRPRPLTVTILRHHAQVLLLQGGQTPTADQLRRVAGLYSGANTLLDRLRSEVLEHEDSKTRQGESSFGLYPEWLGILRQLFVTEGKTADLETAFFAAEAGTARVFLEQLGKARVEGIHGISPELGRQEADLRRRIRLLDRRTPGQRSLHQACSLWSVDDRETAALMLKMYERLTEGDPAATALREAKLAMIRAGKAPLYWAPFILIGE